MTTALLFPGQGTDISDAALDWLRGSSFVRPLLELAARTIGEPLESVIHPLALARTEVLQPVLTAIGVGVHLELAERGIQPDVVAGHSVGELAACVAAGAVESEVAVELAATRGRLMGREASRHPGGMISLRATAMEVQMLLARGAEIGNVCIAVHNAPDEWVVSGEPAALRAIDAQWSTTVVPTPGAWHSPAMDGAREEYRGALDSAVTGRLTVPLISNRTGEAVRDAQRLPELLSAQLTNPVLWSESMSTLASMGTNRVVACGPGKTLRRLARIAMPAAEIAIIAGPLGLPLPPQCANR